MQEAAVRTGHDNADGTVLLDAREPHEWQAGAAPRAVHLPLSVPAVGAGLPARAQARPVIVICRSGNRSRQAVELLVVRGADAVDVIGGMRDWAAAGLPVVDTRGQNGTIA
ncbi:rhodanese-like domain-containing protein [Streptomyces brasiliscabiei]|uniref:Rhodanese-like domain-containing protein n=1 Tax=Streptomyces brasiliscabiei TaxID=2736302 RepID=A0ABU8GL11_9ACTN